MTRIDQREVASACFDVGDTLARIGDKWSIFVVLLLRTESRRFNELKRLIPTISQRMLTVTLRNLERDGFVKRTVLPSVPPRVDYELTALGKSLGKPLGALGAWAKANQSEIRASRVQFDRHES